MSEHEIENNKIKETDMRTPRFLAGKEDFIPADAQKKVSSNREPERDVNHRDNRPYTSSGDAVRTYTMKPVKRIRDDESSISEERLAGYLNEDDLKTKKRTTKGGKKNRVVSYVLTFLAVVCFGLGIYFLVLPSIVHKNQDSAASELLEKLKEQENRGGEGEVEITVKVVDVNAPGSFSANYDVILRPGETMDPNEPTYTEEKIDRDAVVTIKTDTIMRIDKIGLEIAVAPNVRSSSLWVLPGHYPSSVKPGQKGVAAYFGHRMYGKGRHFNRLNEVEKGDIIEVQRKGKIYTYKVDANKIIDPIDLGQYVFEETNKAKIVLVTCHPIQTTGVPKYRIVVQGHLTNVRNVK